jgi:hypothetical protein
MLATNQTSKQAIPIYSRISQGDQLPAGRYNGIIAHLKASVKSPFGISQIRRQDD